MRRGALLLSLAALLPFAATRWCQLESVKTDPDRDYTYAGPWRIDGCTTLELDHGKCDEDDCPHRTGLVDEELIELADAMQLEAVIHGAEGTPYARGCFRLVADPQVHEHVDE